MNEIEVYVLCKQRSKKLVENFLDKFLPNRSEAAEEYPYPQYVNNPEKVYNNVSNILELLENEKFQDYSLYWNNKTGNAPYTGMVFFTVDGGLVVGLAIDEVDLKKNFEDLREFLDVDYGYAVFESVPPKTKAEFINICKSSPYFRLVDGIIFL